MQYKDIDRVTWPQCQKVLPLTYDNSLSYYEAICKLVETLNQVISIVNEIDLSVLDDLRNRIAECERDNVEQDNDIVNLKSDVNGLNNQVTIINGTIDELRLTINDLSERLTTLENYVHNNHEPRIHNLENKLRMYVEPVSVYDHIGQFIPAIVETVDVESEA